MKKLVRFLKAVSILAVIVLLISCGTKEKTVTSTSSSNAPVVEVTEKSTENNSTVAESTESKTEETETVVEKPKLYPASVNKEGKSLWGYIDNKGEFIIKPSFEWANNFLDNGLALVGDSETAGLIDRDGRFVLEQKYYNISSFTEGMAIAEGPDGYDAVNEKGQIVFHSPFPIGEYGEGLADFRIENGDGRLTGYKDKSGKIVIEPKYNGGGKFKDGKAIVALPENRSGVIDKTGKIIKEFDYEYTEYLGEGIYSLKEGLGAKLVLVDDSGNIIKTPEFMYIEEFINGLAIFHISDMYEAANSGIINKSGQVVVKPDYSDIKYLGEGLYAAGVPVDKEFPEMGSRFAIMNGKGKLFTDFVYYGVFDYNNGLASVYDKNSTFFINKQGKKEENIKSVEGIGELILVDDLILAHVDGRVSYLDRMGNVIFKPSDAYELGGGIAVTEKKFRPNRDVIIYYPEVKGVSEVKVQDKINKLLKDKFIPKDFRNIKPEDNSTSSYWAEFSIKYYNKDLLNIKMTGDEYGFGAAHGMPVQEYFHINLKTGKLFELKDLFKAGSNYVDRLNNIIRSQIDRNPNDYFPDSFKGIKENQSFIITKDSLYIYFHPYDIASYADGFPSFEIFYKDIWNIIDTEGELWKAFN